MIKKVMLKRVFNLILLCAFIVVIASSAWFYSSARSNVKTFDATIAVLSNLILDKNPIIALQQVSHSFFNLAVIQVTAFLTSAVALLFLLWFVFRLYAIAEMNALVDPLTELYNRRAIMLGLKSEMERARRFGHSLSIALVDIDYFKQYNDYNGHVAGDSVLKKVAKILDKSVRSVDFVGRIGGEEFLIFFPETSKSEAFKICERMRANIEQAVFPNEKDLPRKKLTISIGISEFDFSMHKTSEHLIEEADKRLYLAKLAGRDTVR
jgi:diguanylate cyclase (GGDEF)-like protein